MTPAVKKKLKPATRPRISALDIDCVLDWISDMNIAWEPPTNVAVMYAKIGELVRASTDNEAPLKIAVTIVRSFLLTLCAYLARQTDQTIAPTPTDVISKP